MGMAKHHVEAVQVILDRGEEGEASKFEQVGAANCWPET
jgi:hypothetical protein